MYFMIVLNIKCIQILRQLPIIMNECIIFSLIYYTFYIDLESGFYSNVLGRLNARKVSVNIF